MKRDMDLVRKLLFYFEDKQSFSVDQNVTIDGYSEDEIAYHLVLIAQAGFIDFEPQRSSSNPDRIYKVYPFGLTWKGHEFLENAKDENLWNKSKEKVLGVTGGLSADVLGSLIKYYAKEKLGIPV
ncbi:hypothetical protein SAE02_74180 [Skermanella aerolata]|uniref:DUF2513 domain-containing protein n=2 Tax=Skermanella aerolata TaxID=393310 RepID=A0A512E475_9PROT|nr:hypothetical protein SAE02_74180 [Skermanella aerolata]